MCKILTVSGASGTGKTILAKHLISLGPEYRMIESVTTRTQRPRDTPGEFLHLTDEEFKEMEDNKKFLWTATVHDTHYGTLKESVGKALLQDHVSIMVITIDCTRPLNEFATFLARHIKCLYILSPGKDILRKRLSERGESPEKIDQRLIECQNWDEEARRLAEPGTHFITNDGTREEFFTEVRKILTNPNTPP